MSGTSAIKTQGLSKRYSLQTVGSAPEYQTLSDKLSRVALAPWQWINGQRDSRKKEWFWALRDIDLNIEHGEVVGIVGRNGNGKSTLLKILSKITAPTKGYADMRGRVCSLLEVGTGFHPELTGAENIYLNGSILGMSRREIRKKFDEIVAFSEVEQFLNMPVKRYSSGMRVRLAFSVAAHLDPDILIIDEVLAVGDLAFQQKCLQRMSEFASTGRTILFVSHNMPAVESLCQRTIHISQGQIVADGPTHEVIPEFVKSMSSGEGDVFQAEVDLEHHLRRGRNHRSILTHLAVRDSQRLPSCALPLGSPCSFEIGFRLPAPQKGLGFSITFSTEHGNKVAVLHSRVHSRIVTGNETAGIIACDLNDLPLLPGEYVIDVSAGTWDCIMDSVEGVTRISILPTDYFDSGELLGNNQGVLALKCKWSAISPMRATHNSVHFGAGYSGIGHVGPSHLAPSSGPLNANSSVRYPSDYSVYDWQ